MLKIEHLGIAVKKLAVFSVNIDDLTKLVLAKPTDYGFSNVTTPICDSRQPCMVRWACSFIWSSVWH